MEAGRNLLGGETSPYLLQHAHNPVHWRPGSAEALAEAKRRDCPILLSIGYAACHWCHVMAHESFENAETARLMNELFGNIKVDREERPDIDPIYMTALHALGPRRQANDRRHLLPAGAALWPTLVPAGYPVDRFRVAHAARSDGEPRPDPRRPFGESLGLERRAGRVACRPHPRRRCAEKRGRPAPWGS